MAHTKIPWKWSRKWEDRSNKEHNGSVGCLEPGILWYGMDGEEGIYCSSKEDACLIEIAPDLLRALEIACQIIEETGNVIPRAIEILMIKAKGRDNEK